MNESTETAEKNILWKLFDGPTRGPMWTAGGVFLYPPKALWEDMSASDISNDWAQLMEDPAAFDPPGLYIHLPVELDAMKKFFSNHGTNPYLECLRREADVLGIPRDLPIKTLYVSADGVDALSSISAEDISQLCVWMKERFNLSRLSNSAVELEGIDSDSAKQEAFAEAGILNIAGELSSADNLQLHHAAEYNASIIGLGWGAISHVRGRALYGHGGNCFKYAETLLEGTAPSYRGYRLNLDMEMRGHLIRAFEDNDRIDCSVFRRAFGRAPQDAFPRIFNRLASEGQLEGDGEILKVLGGGKSRFICSLRFYGRDILIHLTDILSRV